MCAVPNRPRLKDGSERVRRELAGIVDQLSCLRSDSSQLTVTHDAPEMLCYKLRLASEHAGSSANLKCSFLKPFLQLLKVDAPSSTKQGIWFRLQISPSGLTPFLRTTAMETPPPCLCLLPSAFLEALPHLRLHVNLLDEDADSQSVIGSLLGLMEDPDPAVRIRLSQSVRFLLPESCGQSEQSSLSEVTSSSGRHSVTVTH